MEIFFAKIGFMAVIVLILFIIKKVDYYLYCKKLNNMGKDNFNNINYDEDEELI